MSSEYMDVPGMESNACMDAAENILAGAVVCTPATIPSVTIVQPIEEPSKDSGAAVRRIRNCMHHQSCS
jgi:hypothetical protein